MEDIVSDLSTDAIKVAFMISAPLLLVAMAVGILVSFFQALTQINEATLTFVPKVVAIIIVLLILSPWMSDIMQVFTRDLFERMSEARSW